MQLYLQKVISTKNCLTLIQLPEDPQHWYKALSLIKKRIQVEKIIVRLNFYLKFSLE